jgi:hypothetical protein
MLCMPAGTLAENADHTHNLRRAVWGSVTISVTNSLQPKLLNSRRCRAAAVLCLCVDQGE